MIDAVTITPAEASAHLQDDEIHIWRLAYRASERRAPLLAMLATYLHVGQESIFLVENEHGRPQLSAAHASPLDFNWSHSGDHALVAIGRNISLGIDVEHNRERPRALEIAERYFSADEAQALRDMPPSRRSARFLELWTAKEAVLKALGRGIAFGLHRLDISIEDNEMSIRRFEGHRTDAWQLQSLSIDPGLTAAIAWRGGERRLRLYQ